MTDPFDLAPIAASASATAQSPPFVPNVPAPETYLQGLNPTQREAVEATEGPVLVLAGAGTGKTRVLTTRIAHILALGLARPHEVLAVTFTNKAAREMRERVSMLIGRPMEGWWVGTFHSLSARILRTHAEAAGFTPTFTILDDDDQLRLIKQLMEPLAIDDKRWPPRVLLNQIQRWKDRGLLPAQVSPAEGAADADGRALDLYRAYQERLKTLNAMDFGDLLLSALALFQSQPDIALRYQRQFRYILVDEYQDTNVCQYLWLRMLAQGHRNLCCVGDDDQSIYSWRGAEVGNILRFEDDFPGARVIRLERNYRSTPHILAAASGLIANNEGRLGKTLWTEMRDGERVKVHGLWDGTEEARFVGEEIEALQCRGESAGTMAILVRAGFQTREFEERMITLGLPYRVIGGQRFYERQEIRDAVAYLRVTAQPDDDLAFERVVNLPKRGIGKATLQTLHRAARAERRSLTAATARLLGTDELPARARTTLAAFMNDLARWRAEAQARPPAEIAAIVLDESGYTAMWQADRSPDATGRLENLKELVIALEEFDTLSAFLEHVSLVTAIDEAADEDKLTMMTLHGAKGLEFDTVFLPGWEEGLFPHQRALDEGGIKALEEERRLAYVGLTRARRRAVVTYAANRRVYNQWQSAIPSRFIAEIPPGATERSAAGGLYGGVRQTGFAESGGLNEGGWGSGLTGLSRRLQRTQPIDPGIAPSEKPAGTFRAGQRVFHQKFGYGQVISVSGDRLHIAFDKAGAKTVIGSFVVAA